jgi:hypothetical protein
MKPRNRVRTVGTRVSEEEYTALEKLAQGQGQNISEWCRTVLLEQLQPTLPSPTEELLLAEVLASRTIVMNLMYALIRGEVPNAAKFQSLITQADAEKFTRAMERLRDQAGKAANGHGRRRMEPG